MNPTNQRPQPLPAAGLRKTPASAPQPPPPGPAQRPAPTAAPRPMAPVQRIPSPNAAPAPGAFTGAAPSSLQNKFRAARKNSSREYYDTTSFYKAAEAKADADEPIVSTPKPRTKQQIGQRIRRAIPGVFGKAGRIAPVLDALVRDGKGSAEVGRQAGFPDLPQGGGLLGAMARRAGVQPKAPAALDWTDKPLAPAAPSPAFLQKSGIGLKPAAPLISPAPRPVAPVAPAVVGQQKLSEILRQAAGRVGDLLFETDLGAQFLAIETMQEALKGRSVQLIRSQKLQPTWA